MSAQNMIKTESGEVWANMSNDASNPCIDCGACCEHFRISFYQGELQSMGGVVPDDLAVQLTPFMAVMKGTEKGCGKCVALSEEKSCTIYESRPSVCRSYLVWEDNGNPNERCQTLRAKQGLPPLKNLVNIDVANVNS